MRMMAPVRESGTARAAVGGALWAAATSGPPPPPPPPWVKPEDAVELGDAPAPGTVPPPGSAGAGATGSESAAPLDFEPWEEEEDGVDIGAWSGRGLGCATFGVSSFFWGVATTRKKRKK